MRFACKALLFAFLADVAPLCMTARSVEKEAAKSSLLDDAPKQYCISIVTGSGWDNEGLMDFMVTTGDVYQSLFVIGRLYQKQETVVDKCFSSPIESVQVKGRTTNAWAGSIMYSSNGGATYNALQCTYGCTGDSDNIVVDGNSDGFSQAPVRCLDEQTCGMTPKQSCISIVTGSEDHNEGTLDVWVKAGEVSEQGSPGTLYKKQETVVEKCFSNPIEWVEVNNPTHRGWTGSIKYSSDAGATYNALQCTHGCTGASDKIVVDGNSDGFSQAPVMCLNGQVCRMTAA